MSEYKLFIQRIGLVGISQILVNLSLILLVPIISKNYSVQDYGIWVQVAVTLNLIPSILTIGLPYSMMRFLPSMNNKEEIQEGFYSITFVVLIVGIITAVLMYLFSGIIAKSLLGNNILVAKILAIIVFVTALNLIYFNYFRTFQQMKIYSILMILQAYLTMLFAYFFAISGYGISFAVLGILFTQIMLFLISFAFITHYIGFKIPELRDIKEYLALGLPTVPSSLSYWVVESSDRYIIGILLGTTAVGYYSPSYTLGTVINMLCYPFTVILLPLLSKYYDEDKMDKVKLYMKYSLKFFMALAIPSAVGLSLLSQVIIQILSTPEIAANGYFVTPFVTLGAIFSGIYGIVINMVILKKKTKIIGIIWIAAAILNAATNFALIPYFGLIGAAVATLASYTLAFVIAMAYSLKHFEIDFDLPFMGKCIAASTVMSLIILKFYPAGILDTLVVIGACALVYMVVLILLKGFKKEEINFLKSILKGSA